MDPILIKLGPLTLRWYGLLIAIGFWVAYWLFQKRAARLGLKEGEIANFMLLLFVSGILGARVYYVIWNWKQFFAANPREIFMIQHGGLVFFGGFLAACVVLIFWARWKKQSIALFADALALPLVVGQAIGRLGCFMNGCCYGRECSYPWAVRLNSPPEIAGIPVHPTQLYEFVGLLDIALALVVIGKMARYPGQVALSYCLLYSTLRFVVEFFRGDVPHDIFGRFTLAQIVCMGIFLVAWFLAARLSYGAHRMAMRQRFREELQIGN